MSRLPLEDIRIVAVEQYGAGPFGSLHLADLGADVIKVEDPRSDGDVGRYVPPHASGEDSLFFETFNRNKRSISLDIANPSGREVFEDLVRHADAVYSNLRGDVPERLRIRYADLADVNPRIVCCSLSAFGQTGPRRAEPGYDYILQGLAGWMSLTGEPDGPPEKTGPSLVDYSGGLVAAVALLAGVHAARRDGVGTDCDVSLFDTAMGLLTYLATWYLSAGDEPRRTPRSSHPSLVPFGNFPTADGWIIVGCAKEKFWSRLAETLGLDPAEPGLATFADRRTHSAALTARLDALLRTETTAHWLAVLGNAGVPCAPVNTVPQALAEPHTAAREMVVTTEHPRLGTVHAPASPVKVGPGRGPLGHTRAPGRGEHAEELLADLLGYSPARRAALAEAGGVRMSPTLTEQVVDWAWSLDRPERCVADLVALHLLDGLGCALAAARLDAAPAALAVATRSAEPAESPVPGLDHRIAASAAALATGALVHALDFDDTHPVALVHATASVLPALLAAGGRAGSDPAQLAIAALAGYELVVRLGAAVPHGFHARGLHATSVCGVFAAALVAARLAGLDRRQAVHALGIAGSMAAGSLEFLDTGADTKVLHPGLAATSGLLAADLAGAGAQGPASILEGRYGLFASYLQRSPGELFADLGTRYAVGEVVAKPYPCCHLSHATLDALASAPRPPAGDVTRVEVELPTDAMGIVAEPAAAKQAPRTAYEAKFSLAWTVAALLVDGAVGVDTFADPSRADVTALAARVHVRGVAHDGAPATAPGVATITTADGQAHRYHADAGGPPAREAVVAKFVANVASPQAPTLATQILAEGLSLDHVTGIR